MSSFGQAFRSKRVALMVPLGFSSGLPNPLVGSTLGAWMAVSGVDLATIGLFGALTLPYKLKFLWAPVMDRFRLPFLGRRRGWMVATQLALMVALAFLGSLDPTRRLLLMALVAFGISFLSASQDIVTDAYRTDLLPGYERASGTAVFVMGYRLAMIVAGAVAFIAAEHLPWSVVYGGLAALMGVGAIATLIAPSVEAPAGAPETLRRAYVDPLREFFGRRQALATLAVVMLYKVGDAMAGHMLSPFLLELGFGLGEIGAIQKGLGLFATIVGALLGGGLVARWGLRRSLLVFGILQALANLAYAGLAFVGPSYLLLTVSIGVDHLFNGLGTAAFVAFLMTLCDHRFTANQYALLSSAAAIPGLALATGSGFIAEWAGWPAFFILSIAVASPALLLLLKIPIPAPESSEVGDGAAQ